MRENRHDRRLLTPRNIVTSSDVLYPRDVHISSNGRLMAAADGYKHIVHLVNAH